MWLHPTVAVLPSPDLAQTGNPSLNWRLLVEVDLQTGSFEGKMFRFQRRPVRCADQSGTYFHGIFSSGNLLLSNSGNSCRSCSRSRRNPTLSWDRQEKLSKQDISSWKCYLSFFDVAWNGSLRVLKKSYEVKTKSKICLTKNMRRSFVKHAVDNAPVDRGQRVNLRRPFKRSRSWSKGDLRGLVYLCSKVRNGKNVEEKEHSHIHCEFVCVCERERDKEGEGDEERDMRSNGIVNCA